MVSWYWRGGRGGEAGGGGVEVGEKGERRGGKE